MVILFMALILGFSICVSINFLERRELKNQLIALNNEILMLKRNNLKRQAKLIIKNNVKPKITLASSSENIKIRYLGA